MTALQLWKSEGVMDDDSGDGEGEDKADVVKQEVWVSWRLSNGPTLLRHNLVYIYILAKWPKH